MPPTFGHVVANFCRYFGQFLIFISGNPELNADFIL